MHWPSGQLQRMKQNGIQLNATAIKFKNNNNENEKKTTTTKTHKKNNIATKYRIEQVQR